MSFGRRPHDYQSQFNDRLPGAIVRVQGLIDRLEEKREDLAEPEVARRVALADRRLNPAVATDQVLALFQNGHYAQAVFEAANLLVDAVKQASGRTDLNGAALMQTAFSVKSPLLAFNDLADDSDRDEQQGMMYLYSGAVMAIRNPRAHRANHVDSAERALQHLELLSFLANLLSDTHRRA